ncbi:MAG: hypothetical protein JNL41_06900 [Phenylobacterium sp.]|uniref:hypothetical protein n=1 Tax=Phenylobacterium sp. TaxID=1871053 RepID=UPI001A58077C|nr:hypothetical protein [Phenylobacterium sp.]MBL8553990.1 hypothetical protein [Phenylobacterium sp.]
MRARADRMFLGGVDAVIAPLCAPLGAGARIAVVGARDAHEEALYALHLEARGLDVARLMPDEFARVAALRRAAIARRPADAAADPRALAAALAPPRAEALLVVCPWISMALRREPIDARVLDAAEGLAALQAAWAMAPI